MTPINETGLRDLPTKSSPHKQGSLTQRMPRELLIHCMRFLFPEEQAEKLHISRLFFAIAQAPAWHALIETGTLLYQQVSLHGYGNLGKAFSTPVKTIKPAAFSNEIAVHPIGRQIAAALNNGSIEIWNFSPRKYLRTFSFHVGLFSIAFSSDGKTIIAGLGDGSTYVLNPVTNRFTCVRQGAGNDPTYFATLSSDGKTAISATDKSVNIFAFTSQGWHHTFLLEHGDRVNFAALSPDGKQIATSSSNSKTVIVWDASTGIQSCTFALKDKALARSIVFSPNGNLIAVTSSDNIVNIWDIATRRCIHTFRGRTATFSPDGKLLAVALNDRTIDIWNLITKKSFKLKAQATHVNSITFSPDGKWLASLSSDGNIGIWDLATGKCLYKLKSLEIRSIHFSSDGKTIIYSTGKTIHVWHLFALRETEMIRQITTQNMAENSPYFQRTIKLIVGATLYNAKNLFKLCLGNHEYYKVYLSQRVAAIKRMPPRIAQLALEAIRNAPAGQFEKIQSQMEEIT